MRESASSLVGLIKSVETKARNRALKEAGVEAPATGATRTPKKSFDSMTDDEIEAEIQKARGGPGLWGM
jgi:hypothetical protein